MLIKELRLYTNNLSKQLEFYSKVLGFQVNSISAHTLSLSIGTSILIFEHCDEVTPYHFAFNIPSNQEKEALAWLKERVAILKDEDMEIQYFDFWDAYAIYFYDADQNIVEFIARKNLDIQSAKAFSQKAVLGISEIGLPTKNIEQEFKILEEKIGLNIFSGSFLSFCAIGAETGLVICINKELRESWYPTKDKPSSSDFIATIEHDGRSYQLEYRNELLTVLS